MRSTLWAGLAVLALGCSGNAPGTAGEIGTGGSPPDVPSGTTGGEVEPGQVPASQQESLDAILRSLDEVRGLDRTGLEERYPAVFNDALGYAPGDAGWLDLIQASALGLDDAELSVLERNGFVISERQSFPDFTYGYKTIYFEDLPVFVSLDSILYAIHRSYDSLLMQVEQGSLISTLGTLLDSLYAKVGSSGLPAATAADLEVFLAVPRALLTGEAPKDPRAADLVELAQAASGMAQVSLFGVSREMDFSQFEPRGHYTGDPTLEGYFRAMMWLGRVDFRLVETQPDGSRVLRRPQIEAMLALASLFDATDREGWDAIDETIAVFVGEPDSMMLPDVQRLLDDLGITGLAELENVTDAELETTLEQGRYGVQRIASHLMVTGDVEATLPLNTSFTFMGQRYVVDSHVFSNVVYDRVPAGSGPLRLMPNPLDVAFAALGNDQAGSLLSDELDTYGYAQQLAETRILVDAHEPEYWESSLYTLWLGALRSVSAPADADDPGLDGLPAVARTEPWGRRMLNTQLASWAELRHDTLLYAKQSYTGIPSCEYPDAYVDPYPEAFARIARFADRGTEVLARLGDDNYIQNATGYLAHLSEVAGILRDMAAQQRDGVPHTQAQLDFINQTVAIERVTVGCATVLQAVGWYPRLFLDPNDALEADPTIADVHTQPADAGGSPVGRVLHVGTGGPRLMVVTVDSCQGPRAYAGLASAYFERITEDFDRLTDERWATELSSATPADVPWMQDLVVR